MALLRHGTVNFTDKDPAETVNPDDQMTLVKTTAASPIPVYFTAMAFELRDPHIRTAIEAVATHSPQATTVLIAESTNANHPDLAWMIDAYFDLNRETIALANCTVCDNEACVSEAPQNEVMICVGPWDFYEATLGTIGNEQTLIYIPDSLNDQMQLHRLLSMETESTLMAIISPGLHPENNHPQFDDAIIDALTVALSADSQMYHWMEGNASQIASRQPDALAQLVSRYLLAMHDEPKTLLENDSNSLRAVVEATNADNTANSRATLIALKAHLSVLAENLIDGADSRILIMLQSLGFDINANELVTMATSLSGKLFSEPTSVLANIGELSEEQAFTVDQIEAAMLWLNN